MRISVVLSTVMLLCVLALPTFSQQPTQHAFLWSRTSGMQDLGSLGGSSYALALNSSGEVVGYFVTTLGDLRAFLWTANGSMQDIGTLGGANSVAFGINDAGEVSGWAVTTSGQVHSFVWMATGGMKDIGTLGGSSSEAT